VPNIGMVLALARIVPDIGMVLAKANCMPNSLARILPSSQLVALTSSYMTALSWSTSYPRLSFLLTKKIPCDSAYLRTQPEQAAAGWNERRAFGERKTFHSSKGFT
jgi:hypothetical protein